MLPAHVLEKLDALPVQSGVYPTRRRRRPSRTRRPRRGRAAPRARRHARRRAHRHGVSERLYGDTVDELGDASKAVDHAADDMKPLDVRTIMPDVQRKLSDQQTIEADEDLRGALVEM